MKIDQVIAAVIQMRDTIDAKKKAHKEELAPLNDKMSKLEAYIQLQLSKAGVRLAFVLNTALAGSR